MASLTGLDAIVFQVAFATATFDIRGVVSGQVVNFGDDFTFSTLSAACPFAPEGTPVKPAGW